MNDLILNFFQKLNSPKTSLDQLANDVLRLSDYFIQHPDKVTPWSETYCKNAYRFYFLPLNYLRVMNVIRRGKSVNYFKNIQSIVDWGAGPGTATIAFSSFFPDLKKIKMIDRDSSLFQEFKDLHPNIPIEYDIKLTPSVNKNSLLIFSYSLTELSQWPKEALTYDHIMILEPSTKQDGRRLLDYRNQWIQNGYYVWAPCVHQNACPLLTASKSDWCHDRFHVQLPEWFQKLESKLPIKNKTITTSYLLLSKNKPEPSLNSARLTGDSLQEKGKTRQLICRNSDREFLTWMHKSIDQQILNRGDLVELPSEAQYTKTSNEIRLHNKIKVIE